MAAGYEIAFGRCWLCKTAFTFDAERVPSVGIDPVTDAPGDAPGSDPARAVYQPLCAKCVEVVNAERARQGRPTISVLPGAYLDT